MSERGRQKGGGEVVSVNKARETGGEGKKGGGVQRGRASTSTTAAGWTEGVNARERRAAARRRLAQARARVCACVHVLAYFVRAHSRVCVSAHAFMHLRADERLGRCLLRIFYAGLGVGGAL